MRAFLLPPRKVRSNIGVLLHPGEGNIKIDMKNPVSKKSGSPTLPRLPVKAVFRKSRQSVRVG